MLFYLQKYLRKQGFLEIKTSKLIGSASEGGANLFKLDYFGQTACLAQSPQLYKQMAIMGDFKRVFEIGPVFRAENSNSNRHLTEFIGVDIEMVIDKDYMEVVELLYRMFVYVFDKLHQKYHHEIAIIQSFFDFPTITLSSALVVLTFSDAIALLKAHSIEIGDLDDFSTEDEKRLGAIVREKYKTDLFVVTQYPANVRPFYTMPDPKDSRYTYAYDFMLRGVEILSGAQRIHDYTRLTKRVIELGIDASTISHYLDAFKYGTPPHAGAGMGLERILRSFLGVPDIRYCSLFPRDPKRLYP
jgi:aspartyl-tRNA synthetase